MRRLRLLRLLVLLLAVLVALAVGFYLLRDGQPPAGARPARRPSAATSATRLVFTDLLGGKIRGSIEANRLEQRPDGTLRLSGIERLEIERDNAPPLVLRAENGVVAGKPGSRTMHVEGGIEMRDDARGMSVRVEALDWDEKAGEVRSGGSVELTSPEMAGKAASLVYGLEGQATVLHQPLLRTSLGQTMTASLAFLHDGTHDVELQGHVRLRGDEGGLDAGRLRLRRPPLPSAQRAHASEGVTGTSASLGVVRTFRAREAEVDWNGEGDVERVQLQGEAEVGQGRSALSALWIEAQRAAHGEWDVLARGDVRASGHRPDGVSRLRALELRGRMTGSTFTQADARGQVQVEGPQGSAQGDSMELRTEDGSRRVRILAEGGARKASLLTGRARVAADRILVDEGRGRTVAEERVEATLLPAPGARATGPFRADAPVHFVAQRLEATEQGEHLLFTGSVRGWQGERGLAGARVEIDQKAEVVTARGGVTSRLPRREGAAASEADFVQVSADALDYRGKEGKAAYVGKVRLRQSEGWLDAERLEVTLGPSGGLTRALASGEVSFEFRASGRDGKPQQATGKGDRAQYLPQESLLRLFGDHAPATVRKEAPQGGTTEGRVLRYRLDSGVLEVESGARDRGRIETSGT